MFHRTYFAALAALAFLAGCSSTHLSHDDLQSKYRASLSLASETELFVNHRPGHAYSAAFTHGHLSYLQKQGSDLNHDLANASADPTDAASLATLKSATQDLTQTLNNLRSQPADASQTSSIAHLDSLRQRLQAGMPR